MKTTNRRFLISGACSLTFCLALTGLMTELAHLCRMAQTPGDSLLPPLGDYLHPAAVLFLLAGYIISGILLIIPMFRMKRAG